MTTAVNADLASIVQAARSRIAIDLADSAGQPIIGYCHELVDWIVFGRRKPTGSPTMRVRAAVRAAVNVGLKEAYGAEDSPNISRGITTRRDVI